MRRSIASPVVVCLLATAGPAFADRELSLSLGPRHAGSDSMDALSSDPAFSSVVLGAALGLAGLRPLGFAVEIEAGWEHAEQQGTTFQRIGSDLAMDAVRVGARLRRPLTARVSTFARAAAGYATAKLALEGDGPGAGRAISDRAHGGSVLAGGGLDLRLTRAIAGAPPRFSFGLRVEAEYARVSPLRFAASPRSSGSLDIQTAATGLGALDLSGPCLRFGAYGRF
jgi:hypothetical protein